MIAKQAEDLLTDTLDLIKQILVKHETAVLEQMREALTAAREQAAQSAAERIRRESTRRDIAKEEIERVIKKALDNGAIYKDAPWGLVFNDLYTVIFGSFHIDETLAQRWLNLPGKI